MVLAMAEKTARLEALEKQVDDLEARNADADERIERLTQILKAFDRARFGRRSEKLGVRPANTFRELSHPGDDLALVPALMLGLDRDLRGWHGSHGDYFRH